MKQWSNAFIGILMSSRMPGMGRCRCCSLSQQRDPSCCWCCRVVNISRFCYVRRSIVRTALNRIILSKNWKIRLLYWTLSRPPDAFRLFSIIRPTIRLDSGRKRAAAVGWTFRLVGLRAFSPLFNPTQSVSLPLISWYGLYFFYLFPA